MAINKRHSLIGLGVAAIVAAGAIFYYVNRPEPSAIPENGSTTTSSTDGDALMAPGPLGEMTLGDPAAPVKVIEYASLTCSHCAHFHEETYRPFKEKYVDTGKVLFIFREFPLDPVATSGFMLARCAPADRYFAAIDLLFDQQEKWAFTEKPADALFNIVRQAGFTQESFRACLTNQQILDGVNAVKDRASAEFGVNSTPTFFINGKKMNGALSLEELDKEIEPLL